MITSPGPAVLPPEIMSMIWTYVVEDAIFSPLPYDSYTDHLAKSCTSPVDWGPRMADPVDNLFILRHPLHDYRLVSKTIKREVEWILNNIYTQKIDISRYWSKCLRCKVKCSGFKDIWDVHGFVFTCRTRVGSRTF